MVKKKQYIQQQLQLQQDLQKMKFTLAPLQSNLAGECNVFTPPPKVVVAKPKV